jgi:hypothetical protein
MSKVRKQMWLDKKICPSEQGLDDDDDDDADDGGVTQNI